MKKLISLSLTALLFSSCASIFLPKKQKVTFTTTHKESKIYLEKEEIGTGKIVTEKVKKEGSAKQIIIKTPGYKDTYGVLVPSRRQIAYWFLQIPNPLWLGYYGFWWDAINPKCMGYQKVINIPVKDKLVFRGDKDKYVDISNIKLNIKNKDKDIKSYSVDFSATDLEKNIQETEKETDLRTAKYEAKQAKRDAKKKKKNMLAEPDSKEMKYDDTKFSYNVYKTLKSTGFVDTVNKFFIDFNNQIYLEGSIDKLNYYTIQGRSGSYSRCKIFLTWYVKNNYNEIMDSIVTNEYSGDFTTSYYYSYYSTAALEAAKEAYSDQVSKMYGDAIDISYLKLHSNPVFTKYLKQESDFNTKDGALTLPAPKSIVTDKSDAGLASVIVKTADGHGSGLAVTQDGYILTNYHVISGKIKNKLNTVKIINSNGEESEGKIVRYNKYRDIALIKTDKKFEKAFKVTNVKSFKNLQDVFTIGAPKSIELGQTVSTGIISNERKANNNNLLQLNMGVNAGNSGGPLFDGAGNLHGIIVSKAIGKNTEGISFAIPGYLIYEYLNINFK